MISPIPIIHIVDEDPFYLKLIEVNLKAWNYKRILSFSTITSFFESLTYHKPDIVIFNILLEDSLNFDFLRLMRENSPDIKIVYIIGSDHEIIKNTHECRNNNYIIRNDDTFDNLKSFLNENWIND